MFNLQSTCNYRLTKVYEWLIEELRCWIWVCELSVLDILSHRTIVSRACATASMTSSWAFESDYAECEVCSEQNNNNNNRRKPRSKTDARSRFSHSLPPLEVASLQLHLKQPMFHFLPNSVLWACLYDCVLVERTHWSSGLPLFSFCAGSLRFRSGWRDLACSSSSSHSASTCLRFHFTCFRCVSFYCWPHCLIWRQIYRVRTTPSIVPVVTMLRLIGKNFLNFVQHSKRRSALEYLKHLLPLQLPKQTGAEARRCDAFSRSACLASIRLNVGLSGSGCCWMRPALLYCCSSVPCANSSAALPCLLSAFLARRTRASSFHPLTPPVCYLLMLRTRALRCSCFSCCVLVLILVKTPLKIQFCVSEVKCSWFFLSRAIIVVIVFKNSLWCPSLILVWLDVIESIWRMNCKVTRGIFVLTSSVRSGCGSTTTGTAQWQTTTEVAVVFFFSLESCCFYLWFEICFEC